MSLVSGKIWNHQDEKRFAILLTEKSLPPKNITFEMKSETDAM